MIPGLICSLFLTISAACPVIDSLVNTSSSAITVQQLFHAFRGQDEHCFASLISGTVVSNRKIPEDSLTRLITTWSEKEVLSTAVLISCYNDSVYKKPKLWRTLISEWEKSNGSPYDVFTDLVRSGKPRIADTLFLIFDKEGKLDAHDVMRWAKIKGLVEEYNMVAGLYCRVLRAEPSLTPIALSQFMQVLGEMPPECADSVLNQFYRCGIEIPDADTVSLRIWIADAFSRLGLYKQEIAVLSGVPNLPPKTVERLIDAARRHFSKRRFDQAIAASRVVYQRVGKGDFRSVVATILYQSYMEQGNRDSALVWLERADMTSERVRSEAVALYQSAGNLQKAGELIDSLSRSLVKDTLQIRQELFSGNFTNAAALVQSANSMKRSQQSVTVWNVRTLLFAGKLKEVAEILGTARIEPSWEYAGELLSCKYWLQKLGSSPEALATWAQIEYNIYVGKPDHSAELISKSTISSDLKWRLELRAAKGLIQGGRFDQASTLLSRGNENEVSPEYLYFKAEALHGKGVTDSAQVILEKIVLHHPKDVFSGKARIFLSNIGMKK